MQQSTARVATEAEAVRLRLEQFVEGPVVGEAARSAQAFRRWYEQSGHWVYEGRADAVRVWRERGIVGRPVHTPAAEALLRDWIAADWMPALCPTHQQPDTLVRLHPQSQQLEAVHDRRMPRLFAEEPQPITGFGELA